MPSRPVRSAIVGIFRAGASLAALLAACSSQEGESPAGPAGSGAGVGGQDAGALDASGQGGGAGVASGGSGVHVSGSGDSRGDSSGSSGDGSGSSGGSEASVPARYPNDALHSPMSKSVVDRLKAVLSSSKGRPDVVAKVGDSLTVNSYFLGCFAGSDVKLGAYADLEPTRAFFGATPADFTRSSYERTTFAAKVGWSSTAVVAGLPSPLDQEITAIAPGFAVVLIGTNDTYPGGPDLLDRRLLKIVDVALERGVVPLLTTLPQRADTNEAEALVPEMNAVIRAIAEARQVPLMDLFAALADIPDHGLRSDGVHLEVHMAPIAHGCWFDERALQKGINRRNLLTLAALDRARRFLIEDEAPEKAPPGLAGDGSWESPYEVDSLPFVASGDASKSLVSARSAYDCGAPDEAGPEVVYRVKLSEAMTLRARLFQGQQGADAEMALHFMAGLPRPGHCIHKAGKMLEITAGPGTYWIAVDTPAAGGRAQAGDYRLTLVRADRPR